MKIKLVDYGHIEEVELPEGSTVGDMVIRRVMEYSIHYVNGQEVDRNTVLEEGQMIVRTARPRQEDISEDPSAGATPADNGEEPEEKGGETV